MVPLPDGFELPAMQTLRHICRHHSQGAGQTYKQLQTGCVQHIDVKIRNSDININSIDLPNTTSTPTTPTTVTLLTNLAQVVHATFSSISM